MSKFWQNNDKIKFIHPSTNELTNGVVKGYSTIEMSVIG